MNRLLLCLFGIALLGTALHAPPLAAQNMVFGELHQLIASDGLADDEFGSSVAIQGNLVVVGAFRHDVNDANSGAAYVFQLDGQSGSLTEIAKLVVSDGSRSDRLGVSVAIDGDIIVLGADQAYTNNVGRAYVYQRPPGGWAGLLTESALLQASNRGSNDYFGFSVAVSGNTIVVGAYGEDEVSSAAGALYVFEEPLTGWNGILEENAKLIPSVRPGNIGFLGLSVDMEGDVIVSSVPLGEVDGNDRQGRGYVFLRPESGWSGTLTESAELLASDGGAGDRLGTGVAISGTTIAVGARLWEPPGANANNGAVYLFEEPPSGWSGSLFETAKLVSSNPVSNENLGVHVALDGNTVLAGSNKDSTSPRESVYVFTRPEAGWTGTITEDQRLVDDADGENSYGLRVAIDGGRAVASAQLDDGLDSNAGRAYVYLRQGIFADSFESSGPD